jgi:hypothetical protein
MFSSSISILVRTNDCPDWIEGSGVCVGQEGILVSLFIAIGVRVWVGVFVMGSDGADVVVDDGVSSGKVGEGDSVASARSWKEEQAVRRKMNITIKNFFKLMPPA